MYKDSNNIEYHIKEALQKYLQQTAPASQKMIFKTFIEPLVMVVNEEGELEVSSRLPCQNPRLMDYIRLKFGEIISNESYPRIVVYKMSEESINKNKFEKMQTEKSGILFSEKAELLPFTFINDEREDVATKESLICRVVLTFVCLEMVDIDTMAIVERSLPQEEIIPYVRAVATEQERVIDESLLVMLETFLEKNQGAVYEKIADVLYESLEDKKLLSLFAQELNMKTFFREIRYQIEKAAKRKALRNFLQTTMMKQSLEKELDDIYEQIAAQEDPNDDTAEMRLREFVYNTSLRPSLEGARALMDICETYDDEFVYETVLDKDFDGYLSIEEKDWLQTRYKDRFRVGEGTRA